MPVLPGTTDHVPGTLGGVAVRLFGDDFTPLANVTVATAVWSIRETAADADLTTAGVVGTRGGVLNRPVEWTINLPDRISVAEGEDPEVDPPVITGDYANLQAGKACTVWMRVGDNDTWHRITNSLITYAGPVCDATGDVVRWTVSGKYGTLTRYSPTEPAR